MRQKRIVVIGAGNPHRGDDAVGAVFLRRILDRLPSGVSAVESGGEPVAMMDAWAQADAAFVVDAAHCTDNTERVFRFEAHEAPIPAELFRLSTHQFGVAETIELARALDRLPPRLVVYGIRGEGFDLDEALSPGTDEACDVAVERVLDEIRGLLEHG
jgi:hydrogenase maturation protease